MSGGGGSRRYSFFGSTGSGSSLFTSTPFEDAAAAAALPFDVVDFGSSVAVLPVLSFWAIGVCELRCVEDCMVGGVEADVAGAVLAAGCEPLTLGVAAGWVVGLLVLGCSADGIGRDVFVVAATVGGLDAVGAELVVVCRTTRGFDAAGAVPAIFCLSAVAAEAAGCWTSGGFVARVFGLSSVMMGLAGTGACEEVLGATGG